MRDTYTILDVSVFLPAYWAVGDLCSLGFIYMYTDFCSWLLLYSLIHVLCNLKNLTDSDILLVDLEYLENDYFHFQGPFWAIAITELSVYPSQ